MVIRTHLSKFCDFRLDEPPIEREPCAHDDDSGAPGTRAVEMNSITTHIDQLAQRCGRILVGTHSLRQGGDGKYPKQGNDNGKALAANQARCRAHWPFLAVSKLPRQQGPDSILWQP